MLEVLKELKLRRENREADFWTTARKLAAGEKVAPAAVERLLADSGRTPADLKAAVELMQQRRQWSDVVAGTAALEQERTAMHERIAAEDRKLAQAEQAHADATLPLQARLQAIQAALREAGDARRRLMDTCPYADLKAELGDVVRRIAELRTRVFELHRTARECETKAKSDLTQAQCDGGRFEAIWRERAERNHRAAEQAKAELPGLEREIAKLEHDEAALREQMVNP